MLQGRLQNETHHKRKSTTIWEPDFEFSVVFWNENPGDQLCISSSIFTKTISISNLKQRMLTTLQCQECCKVDFRTKRTTRGNRQPFGNQISSFRSCFEVKNPGDQLCISSSIFTKTISISNLKGRMLTTLQCEEYCMVDFRTKRTTRGNRQPFANQISSFRSCFEMKIQATNFAFPALSSPKQSQFQIWNNECWQRCSAKNVAR